MSSLARTANSESWRRTEKADGTERREHHRVVRKSSWQAEKIFVCMHFSLACREHSCILHMRTRFTAARERGSFRRTRVRIEFDFASSPISFPHNPDNKKIHRQAHALAARGRYFLYGVRRNVWNRRNHSCRRLWSRNLDPAVFAGVVVPANGVHDW